MKRRKIKKGSHMNLHTEEAIIRIKNFPNRALAEAGQACLKTNNIEAILQGSDSRSCGISRNAN
jgi:hypothetical protein